MNQIFLVLIASGIVVGLLILGLGIKILIKKGGQFEKSCSSRDPKTGEKIGCGCGGGNNQCHNQ